MKKAFIVMASLCFMFCISSSNANALTYNVYTDYSSFSADAGSTSLYDFESDTVGGNYKVHDFGDFSINGSSLYSVNIEDENTHELHFNTSSYVQNMSMVFDYSVMAFGFDWRNTDNNTDMIRVDFQGTQYVLGAKDESGFWGVVATEGEITSAMPFLFGDTAGGAGWTEGNLDNIRYSNSEGVSGNNAVPEPATMVLLGTGLVGMAFRKRFKV